LIANSPMLAWQHVLAVVSIKAGDSVRFKPKYSDLSGLKAKYRDPKTGLVYANKDEFKRIAALGAVEIRELFAFRGAGEPVTY
jgi:INO80 complex subunit C